MISLTDADRHIQSVARAFVDEELIPWEVHAEMHDGEVPPDIAQAHLDRARADGLLAINQSEELGGPGYTFLQQALIQEQTGRVTNALGWVVSTPAGWLPEVATDEQMERYMRPLITCDIHE